MSTREEIKKLINLLEEEYGVTEWRHNGYYIWPVLRISLYMHLVKRIEKREVINKKKRSLLLRFWQFLTSVIDFLFVTKKNISYIYLGDSAHCIRYRGKDYNRYFDSLMDKEKDSSLYFTKSVSKKNVYKPERYVLFSNLLMGYSYINKLVWRGGTKKSTKVKELCQILETVGVVVSDFEDKANRSLRTVDLSYSLSLFLLKKIKPQKIWALCYYSSDIIGLFIAAHKLSIPTIDMQHGGQGKGHLAYSSWTNLPGSGYEALPNYFYTWDEASAKNINNWAEASKKHSAVKSGNPWVDSWKRGEYKNNTGFNWPNNIILYTLQPTGRPLEPYLLDTIKKTCNDWDWWLRIHPRQMNEIEDIKLLLRQNNLIGYVNIDDATKMPLPEILMHTKSHLTKFSGCAIEAYQFGVPSIIIDERGVDIYSEYLISNDLMFSHVNKSSEELIGKINNSLVFFDEKNNK